MESVKNFYDSGLGDRLIDEKRYSLEILSYLAGEKKIVAELLARYETLIEVGCMNGRYLDLAVEKEKRYIGIDVVKRYVDEANRTIKDKKLSPKDFFALNISAENLESLFVGKEISKPILVFPFNCFGNMTSFKEVVDTLIRLKKPFAVFSYGTDPYSDSVREKYYKSCGYKSIDKVVDITGHRFVSPEGLNTIAYEKDFLINFFRDRNVEITPESFSRFGIYYSAFLTT